MSQHLSPESSRKAYCRAWEQPSQSASFTHMPQSPNVFNEHMTNSTMSPGTAAQSLKSPASIRSRSVSDSSVPRRGNTALFVVGGLPLPPSYPQVSAQLRGDRLLQVFVEMGGPQTRHQSNASEYLPAEETAGWLGASQRDRERRLSLLLGCPIGYSHF